MWYQEHRFLRCVLDSILFALVVPCCFPLFLTCFDGFVPIESSVVEFKRFKLH